MMDWVARRLEVSIAVAALLLVLAVVQIGLQVYALVDLARRGEARGGKKWPWALIVALGGLPGAIIYLAAGRAPKMHEPTAAGASAAGQEAVRRAVDELYGPRDR